MRFFYFIIVSIGFLSIIGGCNSNIPSADLIKEAQVVEYHYRINRVEDGYRYIVLRDRKSGEKFNLHLGAFMNTPSSPQDLGFECISTERIDWKKGLNKDSVIKKKGGFFPEGDDETYTGESGVMVKFYLPSEGENSFGLCYKKAEDRGYFIR